MTDVSALRRPIRTPIAKRSLPVYTPGEEIFNTTSHIAGAVFGVVALVLCVVFGALRHNPAGVVGGAIYGASMFLCYTISSIYHGIRPISETRIHGKKILQVLDHCDIYFLIAGSYTPIALTGLREMFPKTAWWTFGIVWGVCLLGTVFTAIDFHKFAVISYASYFVAGWSVLVAIPAMWKAFGPAFVILLLTGGVVYTLGMVFFALQKKFRYCHSVFHLFILGGSALQFIPIFMFCI